jgi:hypothetical protein
MRTGGSLRLGRQPEAVENRRRLQKRGDRRLTEIPIFPEDLGQEA